MKTEKFQKMLKVLEDIKIFGETEMAKLKGERIWVVI